MGEGHPIMSADDRSLVLAGTRNLSAGFDNLIY
jgi:hypothetical protein